jgi:hypothetical protein
VRLVSPDDLVRELATIAPALSGGDLPTYEDDASDFTAVPIIDDHTRAKNGYGRHDKVGVEAKEKPSHRAYQNANLRGVPVSDSNNRGLGVRLL